MGQKLFQLVERLYQQKPKGTLYHYTTLRGLTGIIENNAIWASEVRYLNDAEELTHLANWIRADIVQRSPKANKQEQEIMEQFRQWSRERLTNGYLLFVTAFTENGNLLSQWRGYCPHGKGVSLGFSPAKIDTICAAANYSLAPCIYDSETQQYVVREIVDGIVAEAKEQGPADKKVKHPSQCYHHVFEELEPLILQIGALIKNSTFREEKEWRFVSPIYASYVIPPIKYREGASMLIPYLEVPIRLGEDGEDLERVYVGPSPSLNLSMNSVSMFLARHVRRPSIHSSQSPYRG